MLLDCVLLLGVGLAVAGVAFIFWPVALIVAGLAVVAAVFAYDRSSA